MSHGFGYHLVESSTLLHNSPSVLDWSHYFHSDVLHHGVGAIGWLQPRTEWLESSLVYILFVVVLYITCHVKMYVTCSQMQDNYS